MLTRKEFNMENQFWDVLAAHPFFVLVVIVGGIFAVAALLTAITKIHGILGFKTRAELEREQFEENEKRRDEQIAEIWHEIKDMREETRSDLRSLTEEVKSVKNANIMVLGDRISQKSAHYLRLGAIPTEEVAEFQNMYETYKSIGGNHGIDQIFEKTVAALPLTTKEEAKRC